MNCSSCSCLFRLQCRPVDLIRGPVFKPLVPAPLVVEVEVGGKLPARLGEALVALQVHLLVLDAPPETFDEDVVHPAAAPIHADRHAAREQGVREAFRGELRALVGVEDLRRSVALQRLLERLDAEGGVEALEEALERYGAPQIFNTDQGAQFTAEGFTGALLSRGVAISMDGRGRWMDNVFIERLWRSVKYEEVYLKAYESVSEARRELAAYFDFYNQRRRHQGLEDRTPDEVYWSTLQKEQTAA